MLNQCLLNPVEGISWVRSRSLPGVELLSAFNDSNAWKMFHERYEVCAMSNVRGGVSGRYRGRSVGFYEPSVCLMEPGETHSTSKVKEGVDFQVLIVSPECFLKAAEESGLPGEVHFRLQQVGAPGLLSAVQRLVAAIRVGESPLEQQSRLACCIRGMLDYAERKPRESAGHLSSRALKLAVNYLRERYQDPVDLEDLSALTGLSRFVLVHAFTHQFGIPPHAYQIRIRIEQSRILLEGGVPPGQVAAEVGFSDQSHFHRHFKHILQVTPGEYVRSGHR